MNLGTGDVIILRNRQYDIAPEYIKNLGWELGRQDALYVKAKISIPTCLLKEISDVFIQYAALDTWHIKVQSSIPLHCDPVTDCSHYRFNVSYKGDYWLNVEDSTYLIKEGDAVLFRSDISLHGIDLFENNIVEIFSVGIFIGRDNS